MDLESEIERSVSQALAEDVGAGDWTASLTAKDERAHAYVVCRGTAVVCGRAWFELCFRKLDRDASITWQVSEGARVQPRTTLCEIRGKTRALLTGERTALNFLQTLSAVSTVT